MCIPTGLERKALLNALGEWEYREKLGGEKTFESILAKGWIEPYSGHNPNSDRFSLTDEGRAAIQRTKPKKPNKEPRLKTLEPRIKPLKSRLDRK